MWINIIDSQVDSNRIIGFKIVSDDSESYRVEVLLEGGHFITVKGLKGWREAADYIDEFVKELSLTEADHVD